MMNIAPSVITNINGKEQMTDLITYDFNKNRVVYLIGEVNAQMALSVCSQLRYLAAKGDQDIVLFINSPGGNVSDGLSIYDTMRGIDCDVITWASGMAASMGAFLLAAGTPGKRYAEPNAEVMIHQPLGGSQGQATDIMIQARHIQRIKDKLAAIMADECGKPVECLMKDLERDHWLTAEEAKEYGLIDQVGSPV